ncbi:MAG: MFS transporter [Novosphingobium sp.]|nr:MFS transporter [Novosphingobium sp.]
MTRATSGDEGDDGAIDLALTIEEGALHPRLLWLVGLLTLALVVDGCDVVMVGFLAPAIVRDFGVSPLALGWLLSIGQAGLIVGGIVGGLLADRAGRRPALLGSIMLFALGSVASALAPGYAGFAAARLFAGLGLGSAAPAVASYLAEVLPRRRIGQLSVLAFTANLLGGTICALAGSFVVPAAGWRAMLWIGGALPLAGVLPPMLALLPESPRFLARQGRPAEAVAAALDRFGIAHGWRSGTRFALVAAASGQGRLRDILAPEWRRDTIVLWLMSVSLMFTSVGLISLGALLLTSLGTPPADAIRTMSFYSFAGLTGAFAAVAGVSRIGSRGTLAALLGIAAAGMAALIGITLAGMAGNAWLAAIAMFVVGFGLNGSLIVLFPLVASFYPTEFRSAGSGAAIGVGRTGSTTSLVLLAAILGAAGPLATLAVTLGMTGVTIATVIAFRGHSRPVGP